MELLQLPLQTLGKQASPQRSARLARIIAGVTVVTLLVTLLNLPLTLGMEASLRGQRSLVAAKAGDQQQAMVAVLAFQQGLYWLPTDIGMMRQLAQAYLLDSQVEPAIEVLERALRQWPTSHQVAWELSLAYEQAIIISVGPNATIAERIDALRTDHRAIATWQLVGLSPAMSLTFGHTMLAQSDQVRAQQWYQRAAALSNTDGDPWYYLASITQADGDWQEADELYKRAYEAPSLKSVGASDVLMYRGMLYQSSTMLNNIPYALELFLQAIADNEFTLPLLHAESYYKSGEIYLQQNELSLALAMFKQALALQPAHAWAHLRMGQAFYRLGDHQVEAEAAFKRAIEIWPKSRQPDMPYRALGHFYRETGRLDLALQMYQTALEYAPGDIALTQLIAQIQSQDQ